MCVAFIVSCLLVLHLCDIGPCRRHHLPHDPAVARLLYTDPPARHDCGRMNIECPHCKGLHWLNERIAASSASRPAFGMCCNHGKIALPSLQPPPPELSVLLTGSDVRAKNFKENICAYNRAFAFTSLGVKEDHSINQGNGPPVFRIQGELAHWSGTLLPEPGHSPVYAQLYIYDPSTAVGYRMANNNG